MRIPISLCGGLLAGFRLATAADAWSDSALHWTLLPFNPPTVTTEDPSECVLANIMQYFDVPMPTGIVSSAVLSHANKAFETCTLTGNEKLYGCFPEIRSGATILRPQRRRPNWLWSQGSQEQ